MTQHGPPLHERSGTGRHRINLRALPAWAQYVVALAVVALVGALAWRVGGNDPIPTWITRYLIPGLGYTYLVLVILLLIRRLASRKKRP